MARLLRAALEAPVPKAIIKQAAATLGRLVHAGGATTADIGKRGPHERPGAVSALGGPLTRAARPTSPAVEQSVQKAMENLRPDKPEMRRYAAAVILGEMAQNAPAVFNVHVRAFIEHVWAVLRDPKLELRRVGMLALRCAAADEGRVVRGGGRVPRRGPTP